MHHSGYEANDRLLLGASGAASVLYAPFACHQLNMAAVTAAIATSGEIPPRQEPAVYVLRNHDRLAGDPGEDQAHHTAADGDGSHP